MKKLLLLIAFFFAASLPSCICLGYDNPLTIDFANRTDEDLVAVLGYRDERNDTTIIIDKESGMPAPNMVLIGVLPPMDITVHDIDDEYDYVDYVRHKFKGLMHVFIAKSKDVDEYGWEEVAEKNMIIQRYDLTGEDVDKIDGNIAFPPSSAMVNINMWPPYGTYAYNTIE